MFAIWYAELNFFCLAPFPPFSDHVSNVTTNFIELGWRVEQAA